jgi:hypothetical protein
MASPSGKGGFHFFATVGTTGRNVWLIKAAASKIDNACAVTVRLECLFVILTVARGNS